jgi:hypothetical protein
VISNDELLYDPDMDDKDEEWVTKQINGKYEPQNLSIDY